MSRGVITLSLANIDARTDPWVLMRYLEEHGFAVIWALDPERVMVDFAPANQRERIAVQLLAASTARNGLGVDDPDEARKRIDAAVRNADMLIESLNPKEPTL